MFREYSFMGISMRPRSRRRILVLCGYLLPAAMIAIPLAKNQVSLGAYNLNFLMLVFTGCASGVFGSLLSRQAGVIVLAHEDRPPSISRPRGCEDFDERDTEVRNAAYFSAFRWNALLTIVAWIAVESLVDSGSLHARLWADAAIKILLVTVSTLPQAILLWREPDMLDE